MNNYGRYVVLLFFYCSADCITPTQISAQTSSINYIIESLPQLKQTSNELNQNVLILLSLIKEYEKYRPAETYKIAKIVKPFSPVKETDNINSLTIVEARMNEEYIIIEERDKWYKIKTQDNREGWLFEEDVQLISKQQDEITGNQKEQSKKETSLLADQMLRYKNNIDEMYLSSSTLIKKAVEEYDKLSDEKKREIESSYQLIKGYKEKNEKYYNYVVRYFGPYEGILSKPDAGRSQNIGTANRFKGTASLDIGRSSYKDMNSNSTTSRRLSFNGIYQIDKLTTANISFNNQNELIQTAFTNNNINAGISRQFSDKLVLGSNFGYNNYADKASDRNSFELLNGALNIVFTPTRKASIFGNANFQTKNFNSTSDNNYQGIIYVFGTNLIPNSKNSIRFQIQGNTQFSKNDFLNFNQIRPQLNYTRKRSPAKSFNLGFMYDILKFSTNESFNNYQKYRADFKWRNNLKENALSRNLSMTYKQYPNNSNQDYFKLGYTLESRKGSIRDEKSSVSSFSYLITYITQRENNSLKDYIDLRWDRSKIKPRGYFNMNIYTRMWNNFENTINDSIAGPDHFVDFFSEFGPYFRNVSDGTVKITSLKFGFILGGHLYFNFDNENLTRNGNSVRGGFAIKSSLKISKASVVFAGSYERSVVLTKDTSYDPYSGNIIYGDNLYRNPSSIQLNIEYRQPVNNNWDVHFNLSTYNIKTDATDETSINPVERKSNLRLFGGVIYKFAL